MVYRERLSSMERTEGRKIPHTIEISNSSKAKLAPLVKEIYEEVSPYL